MDDLYAELLTKIREVLFETVGKLPREDEDQAQFFLNGLSFCVAVLSTELGYLSGLAALGGVPKDIRDYLIQSHILKGKTLALQEHMTVGECEDCSAAKDLKVEIEAN
jgi:hypothetical protein